MLLAGSLGGGHAVVGGQDEVLGAVCAVFGDVVVLHIPRRLFKQAIAEYAQLAAAARAYLRGRRTSAGVVEEVLSNVE